MRQSDEQQINLFVFVPHGDDTLIACDGHVQGLAWHVVNLVTAAMVTAEAQTSDPPTVPR